MKNSFVLAAVFCYIVAQNAPMSASGKSFKLVPQKKIIALPTSSCKGNEGECAMLNSPELCAFMQLVQERIDEIKKSLEVEPFSSKVLLHLVNVFCDLLMELSAQARQQEEELNLGNLDCVKMINSYFPFLTALFSDKLGDFVDAVETGQKVLPRAAKKNKLGKKRIN